MSDALNERLNMMRLVNSFLLQQPALTIEDVKIIVDAGKKFYTNLNVFYSKEMTDYDKVIDCLGLGWEWYRSQVAADKPLEVNLISKAFNLSNPPMAWLTELRTTPS